MALRALPRVYKRYVKTFRVIRRARKTMFEIATPKKREPLDSYFISKGRAPRQATLGECFDISASKYRNRTAYVDVEQGLRKTYAQFKEDVDSLANGLLMFSFEQHARIGIWSPNRYEWAVTQMATAKAGLILVALNPDYIASELASCLDNTLMRCLVFPEKCPVRDYYKIICSLVPEVPHSRPGFITSTRFPYLEALICITDKVLPGTFKFDDMISMGLFADRDLLADTMKTQTPHDSVLILFTSGATARPKPVVLSNFALINGTENECQVLDLIDRKRIVCLPVPMFHLLGTNGGVIAPVLTGMTCVIPSHKYDTTKTLRAIETEKCDVVYGTPVMFIDMICHPDFNPENLSSVGVLYGGGYRFSTILLKQLLAAFTTTKIRICVGYGSTEMAGMATIGEVDPCWLNADVIHMGRIALNVELKIVNNRNETVPIEEYGEICYRSKILMSGYWGFGGGIVDEDGWFHTGDMGILKYFGFLTVLDRFKDLIHRGFEVIRPMEIERILISHPSIDSAQVFAVNDDKTIENVCAYVTSRVTPQITATEAMEFCEGKSVYSEIPKYLCVVEGFPTTTTGKIQKFLMKENANSWLELY